MMNSAPQVVLVTGPARSGKSEWAELLACHSERQVTYIATAALDPDDTEWIARIEHHRCRRPEHWLTREMGLDMAGAIAQSTAADCFLIDSLGTWLVRGLEQSETEWQTTVTTLLDSLKRAAGQIILVSEETGWGIVPEYATGRLFRDRLGNLTRQVAALADTVYLVTAGHALNLSQMGILVSPPLSSLNSEPFHRKS
jgi:adenosylcobinamide kinase/adenosylcobinamide-phosphate guanylyltransferase